MRKNWSILVLAVLSSLATVAQGQYEKIGRELLQGDLDKTVDVVVRFKETMDGNTVKRLIARGGHHKQSLPLIRSAVFTVQARGVASLADDPEVEYVALDHGIRATTFSGTPDYGWMTALGVKEPYATVAYDGRGIGVAVIDSGITPVKDWGSQIVYSESFVKGDAGTSDSYGHGTHVAGIIGGNGRHSSGGSFTYWIRGIAPAVHLINLRVLDGLGASTDSTVIAAIERAIQLKDKYHIAVINLSLGRPVFSSYTVDPLCMAVQQAWQAGIVVVVSAGNNGRDDSDGNRGYGTITAPGNSPFAITVGAMNTMGTLSRNDDKITSYSSKGPTRLDHVVKPDLVAPGNRILSLRDNGSYLDDTYPENRVPIYIYSTASGKGTPFYYQMSGTSLATPMVSGAAALLRQKDPTLTPDQIKARLMKTASKFSQTSSVATDSETGVQYTSQYDIFTIGAGYLDIQAALANSDGAGGTALSPLAAFDNDTGNVYLVGDGSAIWGSSAAWGSSAVWGSGVVLGSGAAWGNSTLWGSSAAWGSGAVAGVNTIWGSSAAWGSSLSGVAEALTLAIDGEN